MRKVDGALQLLIIAAIPVLAGPPFITDDPQPVNYRHWEVNLAFQITGVNGYAAGTAPHLEVNYGVVPEVQLHLLARMFFNSSTPSGRPAYGLGDLELGVKYRFIDEAALRPQVGTFPLIEAPTGDSSKGLGLGVVQVFLPLWLQKSAGPWTTYGGGGYMASIGKSSENAWLFGWEAQRDIAKGLTLGGELFTLTSEPGFSGAEVAFNVGAIVNVTKHHHVLLSAGRDIAGNNTFALYAAYQYTAGPAVRGAVNGSRQPRCLF